MQLGGQRFARRPGREGLELCSRRISSQSLYCSRRNSIRHCDSVKNHSSTRCPYMTPSSSPAEAAYGHRDSRRRQILAAQVRLLYSNANVGVVVTLVATAILGRLQWGVAPHFIIIGWCLYMFLVSVGRFTLGRRYWRTAPSSVDTSRWGAAFAIGAGLAGAGWAAAGI